jgi:hypothetical protein
MDIGLEECRVFLRGAEDWRVMEEGWQAVIAGLKSV